MDIEKMKKSDLLIECKNRGLKNYSKLKIDDLRTLLKENGFKSSSKETSVENSKKIVKKTDKSDKSGKSDKVVNADKETAVKKVARPRVEGIDKKFANEIDANNFAKELDELTLDDIDNEELLFGIIDDAYCDFITSDKLTSEDYERYVKKHNAVKIMAEDGKESEEAIYKRLANKHIDNHTSDITALAIKKLKKYITAKNKVVAEKKPKAPAKKAPKKSSIEEEPEEEESEEVGGNQDDDEEDIEYQISEAEEEEEEGEE